MDALLRDTIEAARWCGAQAFKGKCSLPEVIDMDEEERLRAVELLKMSGQDEDEANDLREPFLFVFSLQEDYENFCVEIIDTRQMQVFSAFERKE